MLAIQIKEVKAFMAMLLNTDLFDTFYMEEAVIRTSHTHIIDGHLQKDFYAKEEQEDPDFPTQPLVDWKSLKNICYYLIKGKRTPLLFKLTLIQPAADSQALLEQEGCKELVSCLKSFVLTIKFDQKGLFLTTGTSFSSFIMDRRADRIWDEALVKYLIQHGVNFETI